jgi:orotidine-5'-phosphate decarboxylase
VPAVDGSPIAFALDFASLDRARAAAVAVREAIGMVKVGLELFVEAGPAAARLGEDVGRPVFLDLKLHDIPETVERAVARAADLGVRYATVHAQGGPAMLRRAVERARASGTSLEIVAVTVLTSLDAGDLSKMGVTDDVAGHAARLAKVAWDEGVRAFVCSPHEARAMRAALGPTATLITPGVRATDAAGKDDQKRVATAARAIEDGADWLVVGRPIRDAKDPLAAALAICDEAMLARARQGRPS